MSAELLADFRAAIIEAGITPPDSVIADGVLHRYSTNGKAGDDAGWYVLHADGLPAGAFGDFRTGIEGQWCAIPSECLSESDRTKQQKSLQEAQRQRDQDKQQRQERAAERAREIWDECAPASADHPYLARKHVLSYQLRIYRGELVIGDMPCDGALAVPIADTAGKLHSLGFINADGEKRYLPGGRVAGCYFLIGGEPDGKVLITEGVATACSVHEATGCSVACAFNAGNLTAVAKVLREKFPQLEIVIAADNDLGPGANVGVEKACEAARAVGGKVAVPELEGATCDFNDLMFAKGADAVCAVINAAIKPDEPPSDDPQEGTKAGKARKRDAGQATALVKFVRARCQLVHDENAEVYAIDQDSGEVRHIRRRAFKNWLHAAFFEAVGKAASSKSFAEAQQTLSGLGIHRGELARIHVRCAVHPDGGYVIDLGEPGNSRAIRVKPGSWSIADDPGVLFIRPESLLPLPEPVRGGDLEALWKLVNIPKPVQLLVLAWMLDCWRPDTDFPILELIGEHGTAKSCVQRLLSWLIDPTSIELRSAPKSSEDVYVGAGIGWLLNYDNISHLTPAMQDTFCRLATGATHATRLFYTNDEEATIRAKRPVSLNSIAAAITQQDLVDRAISIELPVIGAFIEKKIVEGNFKEAQPTLIGALLDLFASALTQLPAVKIEPQNRPRMLEFAQLGCAVAQALKHPQREFLAAYQTAREESVARTIDASPVATAFIAWWESMGKPDQYVVGELFQIVTAHKPPGCEAWPHSPKGFGDALRRIAPALRMRGVHISRGEKIGGKTVVTIAVIAKQKQSPESPESPDGPQSPAGKSTEPQDIRTFRTSSQLNPQPPADPPESPDEVAV